MNDPRTFLLDLSYRLLNTPTFHIEDSRGTKYIAIEASAAKEIADRLQSIADTMILH